MPIPAALPTTSVSSPTQNASRRGMGKRKEPLLPRRSHFWRYNERITEDGFSGSRLLRLEDDLFAVVLLVLEDVVAVGSLLQGQGVGDDEGRVEVAVLNVLQQRLHVALDMALPALDGQRAVHH